MPVSNKKIYIDPSSPTSGTGTRINPYNSFNDVFGTGKTLPDGKTDILVRAGTMMLGGNARQFASLASRAYGTALDWQDRAKNRVYGTYGESNNDDRFIMDAGVARRVGEFTRDPATGLWFKKYAVNPPDGSYTQANNIGSIRQDGRFITDAYFLKWFDRSQNSTNGTNGTLTQDQVKQQLIQNPGSFTFFQEVAGVSNGRGVLWVNPYGGFSGSTVLYVSEYTNGMQPNLPMVGTLIDSWGIYGFAGNGIQVDGAASPYIANLTIRNVHVMGIGGALMTDTLYYGNGIQIGPNAPNATIEYCRADQIFDSPYASQVFAASTQVSGSMYQHCEANDYGLSAFEMSPTGGKAVETPINRIMNNLTIQECIAHRGGQGWSRQRYGVGGSFGGCSVNVNPQAQVYNVKMIRNKMYDLLAVAMGYSFCNGTQLLALANEIYNCKGGLKMITPASRTDQDGTSIPQSAMQVKYQSNVVVGGPNSTMPGIQIGSDSTTDHTGSMADVVNNLVANHPIGIDHHLPSVAGAAGKMYNNLIVNCATGIAKDGAGSLTKATNLLFGCATNYVMTNGATLIQGSDILADPMIDFGDGYSVPVISAFSPVARAGSTYERVLRYAVDGSHATWKPHIGPLSSLNG